MKTAWLTAAAAALALTACEQQGRRASSDPYAGLDEAIRDWRLDILKSSAACQGPAPAGEACQQFSVVCKIESPMTEAERAQGVTQKVLAAMTWTAHDPAMNEQRPASGTAMFVRAGGDWTREEAEPVNLRTCGPL